MPDPTPPPPPFHSSRICATYLSSSPYPRALPRSLASLPCLPPSSEGEVHPTLPPLAPGSGSTASTAITWSTGTAPKPAVSPSLSSQPLPFRMASSLPPVPPKLVRKIQALEFVEMRELLPDNLAPVERLEALPVHMGQSARNPEQREIASLHTWTSSFATYVAVLSQAHPSRVVDMLAYMRIIIREAHKHGGMGWLTYDAVFRRNQQGLDTPWNIIDPSLHTAYIAGQNRQPITPRRHCHETDHGAEDCALAPIIPATTPTPAGENGIPCSHV